MCWTLLPQSICISCGFPVHFPQIQDPCNAVVSNGLPFAACGDSPWMAIEGPEDVTCYDCLVLHFPQEPIPENVRRRSDRVYRVPRASFQPLYDPSPAVPGFPALLEAPPRPSSSNLRRPPPAFGAGNPPRALSVNNYPAAANPAAVSGRPSTNSGGRWPSRPRGGRGGPSRMRYGLQPSSQPTFQAGQGAMPVATTSSIPAAAPIAPRGRGRVTYAAPTTRGTRPQQVPPRAVPRPHTPMPAPRRITPTTAQTEDDDDYDDEEEYDDEGYEDTTTGGAHLPSSSSSAYFSDWSSSNPHSGPRHTLPGADSPFGWGHTAPRRNPTTTPVVANFLSDYLASPTTYAPPPATSLLPPPPPPIPNAQPNDAAWIPTSWGAAVEMPADLARDLNVTTADCVFRQHRVYFVPDLWEEEYGDGDGEGDTVLIVTPCGTKVRVLSYQLYISTSAAVNARARQAELQAQEAEKQRRKEEKRRRKMGMCIYHPCRVAGCPCDHEVGQHQPLNIGHFIKANRRLSEGEKADQQQQQQQQWRRSSIKGKGKGKEKEVRFDDEYVDEQRGRSPTRRSLPPPGVSLQPTEDEDLKTPSTLHLSPVKTNDRAPKRLVEKDGEVKSRPFKDFTMHSDGSPSPPQQRRRIQSAEDEAASTEDATQSTVTSIQSASQEGSQGAAVAGSSRAVQSEAHHTSKARAKLGAKFDMSDLRIGEDDEEIF
ncbi:hypothetical protein CKAH01_14667 [Colletotrichum kahawae]|uniref:Uncharacterized protein n=1 Tax=Colletotrichum kahawae TaxID=34407 RepID=A0AAE0D9T7_COLKA|nr:hypothetical protein CKAH01_14667 [Colletotrichum kahawae]